MIRIDGRRLTRLALAAGTVAAAVAGMSGAASAGPATPPTGTIHGAGGSRAIAGSYIVVLKPESADAAKVTSASQELARRYGGTVLDNYLATFRGFHVRTSARRAARLAADPAVASVVQDSVVQLSSATQTNPPWGLDRIDQRTLPLSRTYTYRPAANVTAYVLDTGIRISHTQFGGRARNGWDFIENDAVAQDCNGHGTHVAGTIGSTMYGVAKDVRLVAVRVLNCQGSGSYSTIIAAIDWVTQHAVKPAVVNMSVGGPLDATLNAALTRSIASGITYVVAAGNDNRNACTASPAATPQAITVGATDSADARAYFSNWGSCVDLFAPGVNVASTYNAFDTATATMSGTSMATPHVAGAAALVLGANPAYTPAQVSSVLLANATPGRVVSPGTGSPNLLVDTGWLNDPAVTAKKAPVCPSSVAGRSVAVLPHATATSPAVVTGCTGDATATTTVSVAVTDRYRGALTVTLVAPGGRVFTLKPADSRDVGADLVRTYPVDASAVPRNGTWQLRVRDLYGTTGTVRSWSLRF
jgi:subtilisin family serine protease